MGRIACPSCGTVPDDSKEWLRVDTESTVGSDTPTIQLLLDDTIESRGSSLADETIERMATFYPCGHSFPHDTIDAIVAHRRVLDELLERHDDTTDCFETQCLREEIRSVSAKIDAAANRCVARMETTQPNQHGLSRIDASVDS